MPLSYNLNIPASVNNPSDDQPKMEVNFNSINTWTGVDHYNFEATAPGTHQQVSLTNQSSITAPTGTNAVLYSSSTAVPTWFVEATNITSQLAFGGASSINTNGYITISGIIIQWGTFTAPSGISSPINFPTPFLTNCWNMQVSLIRSSTSSNVSYPLFLAEVPTLTSFKTNSGLTNSHTAYFIAIGN